MIKKIMAALFLFTTIAFASQPQVIITGTFYTPSGSLFNGKAIFYLPFAGTKNTADPACPSCPMVFQGPSTYPIINGKLVGVSGPNSRAQLVGNGDISPGLTYYQVRLEDQGGIYSQVFYLYIPSSTTNATFDIGSAIQTSVTTQNLSFPPVVAGPIVSVVPGQLTLSPPGYTIGFASPTNFPSSISVPQTATVGTQSGYMSAVSFLPDPQNFCDFTLPNTYDMICDLNGTLVYNGNGTGGQNSYFLVYQYPIGGPQIGETAIWNGLQWIIGYVNAPNNTQPGAIAYYPLGNGSSSQSPDSNLYDNGALNYLGVNGLNIATGNGFSISQNVVGVAPPYSVRLMATPTEPSTGLGIYLPPVGTAGSISYTYGNGAAGSVSCTSCGTLLQANVSISAGGTYNYPPGCRVLGGGGSGATCRVTTLNASGAVIAANVQLTNGGTNYASAATLQFVPQMEPQVGVGNRVFLNTNFTTAASTSPQTFLSYSTQSIAQTSTISVECWGLYSQATANAAVAFGVTLSAAPTNASGTGVEYTAKTASTGDGAVGINSTSNTTIVSATPTVFGTIGTQAALLHWHLYFTFENPAVTANTLNLTISTANSSDLVTIYRDATCKPFTE